MKNLALVTLGSSPASGVAVKLKTNDMRNTKTKQSPTCNKRFSKEEVALQKLKCLILEEILRR